MSEQTRFHYEPTDEETLSMAIISAIPVTHHEDVLE